MGCVHQNNPDTGLHLVYYIFTHDLIAVGGMKNCVEIFETVTGQRQAMLATAENLCINSVAFSPDDTSLVTASSSVQVSALPTLSVDVWDLQTGGVIL
jgi:WD40 repeat protein